LARVGAFNLPCAGASNSYMRLNTPACCTPMAQHGMSHQQHVTQGQHGSNTGTSQGTAHAQLHARHDNARHGTAHHRAQHWSAPPTGTARHSIQWSQPVTSLMGLCTTPVEHRISLHKRLASRTTHTTCSRTWHSTARHDAAQHGLAWHCMAQHGTAWHRMPQHAAAWPPRPLHCTSSNLDHSQTAP
jgi:hypothetical protein